MVEVKATATMSGENQGTEVSVKLSGEGMQIANEALSVIEALMGDIKENSVLLHALCLEAIANNPGILLGNTKDNTDALREEIAAKMSAATDKNVIV